MIGLREDRRMAVRLISRINALFPVAQPVEEGFPCGKGACPVARGVAPSPQDKPFHRERLIPQQKHFVP